MKLALQGERVIERLALRVGLIPAPAAEAWAGMALSGVLIAAAEAGVLACLARRPHTAAEVAADLDLDPTATLLLLRCLSSVGYLTVRGDRYRLGRSSARWLDPASRYSVTQFVAGTTDYWDWWKSLPDVLRTGRPVGHHLAPPEDPYWDRYVSGQFDLARLTAAEVVRRIRLPRSARTVVDVGGGHGWYSAQLCRRHPSLRATVVDLEGSARVGREIIAATKLADRVRYRDGDALEIDLGDGYDAALCFNLVHHLEPRQIVALFKKIHAALSPGGTLAILDAFRTDTEQRSAAADMLGMFVFLSSGARSYTPAELRRWCADAGFSEPTRRGLRRVPGLALYQTNKI
jgi:SAM-dependent methyltransferase